MMMINFLVSRDSFVKWGIRAASAVILAGLALCAYWIVIDRSPPIEVHGGEVTRYQIQPDGGWIIFVRWSATRHRVCAGNSKRWIDGGAWLPLSDIPYPPIAGDDRPLGEFTWEVPVPVPVYFASTDHAKGAYRIEIEYACNPLQHYMFPIRIVPPPVPFELPEWPLNTIP